MAPPIERMFRCTRFLATERRDAMVREGRGDDLDRLVAEARACPGIAPPGRRRLSEAPARPARFRAAVPGIPRMARVYRSPTADASLLRCPATRVYRSVYRSVTRTDRGMPDP